MARFATPPTTWEEVLVGYPAEMQAVTVELRDVVRAALPMATETVQGARVMGYAQYWIADRNDVVAMISPEDHHVKLYVHHITKDQTGALKVEGTGKNARHVKLQSVDPEAVRGLLDQVLAARG